MSKNSCCLAEFTDFFIFLGMNKCKCHINQQSITANSVKIMATYISIPGLKKKTLLYACTIYACTYVYMYIDNNIIAKERA